MLLCTDPDLNQNDWGTFYTDTSTIACISVYQSIHSTAGSVGDGVETAEADFLTSADTDNAGFYSTPWIVPHSTVQFKFNQ